MYEPVLALKFFISLLNVITHNLKAVHCIPSTSKSGNIVQIPPTIVAHNESIQLNITSNNLSTNRTNSTSKNTAAAIIKVPTTKPSRAYSLRIMLGENKSGNSNSSSTTRNSSIITVESTPQSFIFFNYTTVPPSHNVAKHHFNRKILEYVIIPIGCLLAIVVSYFLVRHVQKVRRKRRLERELFHQYSEPNSEADDMEEHNIGDIESVINAQFVSFNSDHSDKNLYEEPSEVNLVFDETSKLVVQEEVTPVPSDSQASTSFNS